MNAIFSIIEDINQRLVQKWIKDVHISGTTDFFLTAISSLIGRVKFMNALSGTRMPQEEEMPNQMALKSGGFFTVLFRRATTWQ